MTKLKTETLVCIQHANFRRPQTGQNANSPQAGSQIFGTVFFAVLATCYALAFFACTLTSLGVDPDTGSPLRRTVFWLQSLLPDRIVANWFAGGEQVGLADRLPIAAAAALMWMLSWALGRLVLCGLNLDRRLANLERSVLAAGVGANLFSLSVLGLGLTGNLARVWLVGPLAVVAVAALACEYRSLRRSRADR